MSQSKAKSAWARPASCSALPPLQTPLLISPQRAGINFKLSQAPEYITGCFKALLAYPESYLRGENVHLFTSTDANAIVGAAKQEVLKATEAIKKAAVYLDVD